MKPHKILKSFSGSHDGINTKRFEAGSVTPLSDSLAAIVVKEGWAEPHADRETKVVAPAELKAPDESTEETAEQPKRKKR